MLAGYRKRPPDNKRLEVKSAESLPVSNVRLKRLLTLSWRD